MAFLAAVPALVAAGASAASAALPTLSTIATIGSAIAGIGGTLMQGQAAQQAAKAQAAQQLQAAEIARQNQSRAVFKSQVEAQESDFEAAQFIGQQISQQAASGIDIGMGSAVQVRQNSAAVARRDALTIRQQGDLTGQNYYNQAVALTQQAALTKAEGKNAMLSSYLKAGSQAFSAIGSVSSPWKRTNEQPTIPAAKKFGT